MNILPKGFFFKPFFLIGFICFFASSIQAQQIKKRTDKNVGFWSYVPPDYHSSNKDYPLLVFLHGIGERGNDLDLVARNGIPKLINQGNWPSSRPFIVISPQLPSGMSWDVSFVDDIIEYVKSTYRVDESRIYLTGLSWGGMGAWRYAMAHPEKLAAVVPIAGSGDPSQACQMKDLPVWAFHGAVDNIVNTIGSINLINALKNCSSSILPKLTIYPGIGHNSWGATYTLSAGHDIYSWMLSHRNKAMVAKNKAPVVNAGEDKTITLPENSILLTGSAGDEDGSITTYAWTKTSGPDASMEGTDQATLKLSELTAGTYVFKLSATDNADVTVSDEVTVKVMAAEPENKAPVVNNGEDKTITLPENSLTLTGSASDEDGSIATYAWAKTSGPDATMDDTGKATLKLSGLSAGIYIFTLTVTDDKGATAIDKLSVTVNASESGKPVIENQAPVVKAGDDKTITLPANNIILEGSASDKDGTIANYAWTKTSGPDATMEGVDKPSLKLPDLTAGIYIFKLSATDDAGATVSDEVTLKVVAAAVPKNKAPVVKAGEDKTLTLPDNSVTLTGSAHDEDGTIASYAWAKASGPDVTMAGTDKAALELSGLSEGTCLFTLTVTDDKGATAVDKIMVTVNAGESGRPVIENKAPVVKAGEDKTLTLPDNSVTLTGSARDEDGTIATYAWTKASGPDVTMTGTDKAAMELSGLSEGTYIFTLTVTDDKGATTLDKAMVTVNAGESGRPVIENKAPVVKAGEDKTLTLPDNSLTLKGSARDEDGTIANYTWTKASGPDATMAGTDKAALKLSELSEGIYIFKLAATDNKGAVAVDKVMVTVNTREIGGPVAENLTPRVNAGKDKTIALPADSLTLKASATDEDGTIATYAWTKASGPDVTMAGTDKAVLELSGLSEGIYIFTLTVTDEQGATAIDKVMVTVGTLEDKNKNPVADAGPDKLLMLPKDSITLYGSGTDEDGTIAEFSWIKVSGPNTVTKTNKTNLTLSGLVEGNYVFRLTVMDNKKAKDFDEVKVFVKPPRQSDLSVSVTSSSVSCHGSNNGVAEVLVFGGYGPYTYKWSNGADSSRVSGLTAGAYTVEVSDKYGLTGTAAIVIQQPRPIEIKADITHAQTGMKNGAIALSIAGGKAPYKISWSHSEDTVTAIDNLTSGTYSVQVTDQNSCTSTASFEVNDQQDTSVGKIVRFVLINSETNQAITELNNGAVLNLETLPSTKLNVQAVTGDGKVESVRFIVNEGEHRRVENEEPFAAFGSNKGNYMIWTPEPGQYRLTALPYNMHSGKGDAGESYSVEFEVIEGGMNKLLLSEQGPGLNVYPNPFRNYITLEYPVSKPTPVSIRILDQFGVYFEHKVMAFPDNNTLTLDLSATNMVSDKFYFMQISAPGKESRTIKIFKE